MSALAINTVLIAFRLMPLLLVTPLGLFRRAPVLARLFLLVALSLVIAGATTPATVSSFNWSMLISEFLIGVSLAFSFLAAQAAVQTMGRALDQQIGFAAANVLDPTSEQMESLTGQVMLLALMMTFVTFDVHHAMLRGVAIMVDAHPPGTQMLWSENIFRILGVQFFAGFALAAPVMLIMWLVDIALAFVSRSLPQANIYFVGLPLKVAIGTLALAWLILQGTPALLTMLESALNAWSGIY